MRLLLEGLERLGLPLVRSGANFALARVGTEHASLVKALRERGILVRDRSSDPLLEGCVRFTAGPLEHVRRLLDALEEVFRTRALLLDMDGTLVDVSRSYIACCAETASLLLREEGLPPETAEVCVADVLALKATGGGTNDDWVCTRELVLQRARAAGRAIDLPLERVIEPFQALYLGKLAATERWLPAATLLERLSRRYRLGLVTGRPRAEVDLAFALEGASAARPLFGAMVAREDVFPRLKPDPAGIDRALGALGCGRAGSLYVGDSTDDMRAATAAGVRAIGLLAPGDPDPERTRAALLAAGAECVLDGIAALEGLLL
jgi:HAD superfamily hydrolase (TIGR01549 family)